jgi:hypothetical protein
LVVLFVIGLLFAAGSWALDAVGLVDNDKTTDTTVDTCEALREVRRGIIEAGDNPNAVDDTGDVDAVRSVNADLDAQGCEP